MNLKTVKSLALVSTVLVLGIAAACIKRVIPIPPPSPATTLKNGLLLYLPFDGNVADSSGNHNASATVITPYDSATSGLTTDANGKANNAWKSDGAGSYVKVTNNGSVWFDSTFSLAFDVLVNATNYTRQSFVSMVNTSDAYGPSFAAGLSVPGYLNYAFGVDDTSAGCSNNNQYSNANVADTSNFVPQAGVWYHIVNTYYKGTISVYINGQLKGTQINPLNHSMLLCPSSTINVGYWWDTDQESLNGKIDEIRIYNRVLTGQEITALANL